MTPALAARLPPLQIPHRQPAPIARQAESLADVVALAARATKLSLDYAGVSQFADRGRVVVHVATPLQFFKLLLATADVSIAEITARTSHQ
jgi:hypothetical protein